MNDPFVELLVELQWATGRLVREYTFLLDPPEYKSRALALAQKPKPVPAEPKPAPVEAKPAEEAKPVPPIEPKPIEPAAPPPVIAATPAPTGTRAEAEKPAPGAPAAEPAKPEAAAEPAKPRPRGACERKPAKEPAKAEETTKPELVQEPGIEKAYEVMKGDTLGKIARDNLPPGVSLNQMLIAIYRANQDAFIRENLNLVRAGRILNIPTADAIGTVDADEANRLVRAHMAEFREYRSRLAAVPATADASPGQREAAGPIETKPEAPKPAAQDQVRLSKVDPQKPSAPGASAARGDDAVARERALKEAQSRISDLEKNVADLQKLLELKNQQLAEMEKKAAAAKPAPAPAAPAPAPAAKAPEAPKPTAEAPKPGGSAQAGTHARAAAPAAKAPEAPKPAAPRRRQETDAETGAAAAASRACSTSSSTIRWRLPALAAWCCCCSSTPSGHGEKKRPHKPDFRIA